MQLWQKLEGLIFNGTGLRQLCTDHRLLMFVVFVVNKTRARGHAPAKATAADILVPSN